MSAAVNRLFLCYSKLPLAGDGTLLSVGTLRLPPVLRQGPYLDTLRFNQDYRYLLFALRMLLFALRILLFALRLKLVTTAFRTAARRWAATA